MMMVMTVVMVAVMPVTFTMAVVSVAMAVAVTPMMMVAGSVGLVDVVMANVSAVQITGNFCNDVERPDVAFASMTNDGVG